LQNFSKGSFKDSVAEKITLHDQKTDITIEISPEKFNKLVDARYDELRNKQSFLSRPKKHAMKDINTYFKSNEFEKAMAKLQYSSSAATKALTTSTTHTALCELVNELALTQRVGLRGLYENCAEKNDREMLLTFCRWYEGKYPDSKKPTENELLTGITTAQKPSGSGFFKKAGALASVNEKMLKAVQAALTEASPSPAPSPPTPTSNQ
ncbi:MAG TPA: hypothetical protein VJL60_03195, partial [Gammaproteobacteria bacterium]|nr:hypothetical protein [Gammaproteobacteria bacterium]